MSTASLARRIGLVAGPVAAVACYGLLPAEYADATGRSVAFSHPGRATLAMLVWMAVWWMTEATEIEITALLPLVAFPLAGIATAEQAAAPYASSVVFLFLGGFVIAIAIQRCGLDRRLAFLTLRLVGTSPSRLVAGLLAATALISMWVSNTAAAAMMVPIAVAVVGIVPRQGAADAVPAGIPSVDERNFATAAVLAIAYGASIGGVATLIGSPPNGIAAKFIAQTYGKEITFLDWLAVGLPTAALMLPAVWFVLTRIAFPSRLAATVESRAFLEAELRALGPLSPAERRVLVVFLSAILLWITRPWLAALRVGDVRPLAGLTDAGVAMIAAVALFLLPGKPRQRAMDWAATKDLPWGVLLLFGGGLSLAAATETTGVAGYIGSLTVQLGGLPVIGIVLAVIAITTFASELTSNTAQVALMLPLLAAAGPGLGVPPQLLLVPCALAASLAFMMPVGTPPNAIVFGTGLVTIPQMMRAGFLLNIAGIVVVTLVAYLVILPLLGGTQ